MREEKCEALSCFVIERKPKDANSGYTRQQVWIDKQDYLIRRIDFLKLVLMAMVIASPLAYYFMQQWLSDFAYRVDIQWWMFVAAGLVAVAIAFLTVGFQAVKAALANPVRSLRSE